MSNGILGIQRTVQFSTSNYSQSLVHVTVVYVCVYMAFSCVGAVCTPQ